MSRQWQLTDLLELVLRRLPNLMGPIVAATPTCMNGLSTVSRLLIRQEGPNVMATLLLLTLTLRTLPVRVLLVALVDSASLRLEKITWTGVPCLVISEMCPTVLTRVRPPTMVRTGHLLVHRWLMVGNLLLTSREADMWLVPLKFSRDGPLVLKLTAMPRRLLSECVTLCSSELWIKVAASTAVLLGA